MVSWSRKYNSLLLAAEVLFIGHIFMYHEKLTL